MKEVIKSVLIKLFDCIKQNKNIIYMCLPFLVMDIITRCFGSSISFYKIYGIVPNLFTIIWIILFIGIVICCKSYIGKYIYIFFNVVFLLFFMINNIYYSMTNTFFSFNLLESTSEGVPYLIDAIKNCNILVYFAFLFIIGLIVIGYKNINKNDTFKFEKLIKILCFFLLAHIVIPVFLGRANEDLVWSTWKNPRNVYNLYNDSNKSMKVSGLFEYTFRNFYVTYLRKQKTNEDDLIFLEEEYSKEKPNTSNNYTSMYKGKNLIFIQLEGLDTWMLTKEDTPTLYNMMKSSINFNNHYSFYNGGGSTFNSEFAVNTGFIVPLSFTQNAYAFNKNSFPFSMAHLFKDEGYAVNAFHMNSGEYYSRTINYKNWGYDNYYGLLDMFDYKDEKYKLDREMIINEQYSDLMFPEDKLFVDYLIAYSSHLPFVNTKGVCKMLYDEDNAPALDKSSSITEIESNSTSFVLMSEEQCARRQAKETDYMVKLLINKLKEKELYDNTVIVVFTDHYLYTLEDQSILDRYKNTSNHLINNTPFFIFDGKTTKTIKSVTSQLNILPTILNMFGMDYNSNNYIGSDALDKDYSGIVFFSDYSWYDGYVYTEGGEVANKKNISEEVLNNKNVLINYLAKKNDLTLKYNYFKKIKK